MKNKKSLGQHWLKNRVILEEIAELAGVDADAETVCLEIGPGLGTLTSSLFRRFKKIVAVEYDADLARKLPGQFPGKDLEVVNADFLAYDLDKMQKDYVIAGNIPYYITSPIIEKVLTAKNRPRRVVLLMQKEVAERIVSEKETLLSLMVKNRAEAALKFMVPASEFTPPPKVDSAVLVLKPHAPAVDEAVWGLIRAGFSAPRKKLTHNLAHLKPKAEILEAFQKLGLSENARPADLHLPDWQKLYQELAK